MLSLLLFVCVSLQPSFEKVHPLSFHELGLGELVSIYSDLRQMGTPPAILDADELQRDPEVLYYETLMIRNPFHLFMFCVHSSIYPGYITWSLR